MKVLLYFEGKKVLAKSGIGRALEHQMEALSTVGIEYTLDPASTDYDILHINTYGPNSQRMIAKARRLGKKVIYHAHSTEEDFRNSFVGSNQLAPLFRNYLVRLYSKADCLITPTDYSKELLENYGLKMPIKVVSNGIKMKNYQPNSEKEQKFRQYFDLKPGEKVIICVGLYFKRKGIYDFVEIARQMPEYKFIWFGYVPLYSIPKEIRKIVKTNHPSNVLFPGYIKGDIIQGAYSAADLFFFPSYEETEGIVVLEALASKQNVLVRDIPVYKEWLESGKNCFMEVDNKSFKRKIKQIVGNQAPDVTRNGYQTAKKRSIESIGKELLAVYQSVLNYSSDLATSEN
ncbi:MULTISPECIES: glycosyltransferase [Enterococcus]|uniref:Glycosyl transferase n=1 Tax=Candidatus Enterococcus ferrettii TaxID=2815324 RepID=A0ABV0ER02_9ENTE|nr:glycosyltransferase [Enterococcus sp. 665A]MBO1341056.1 glycosyltransferase [Enterococcus sp. 665A]